MRKIALLLLMTLSGVTTSLMAQVNIPGETQGSTQTSPTIPEMNGKGPRVILRQPSSGGLIVPAWIWEQIGSGGSGGGDNPPSIPRAEIEPGFERQNTQTGQAGGPVDAPLTTAVSGGPGG